MAMVHVGKREGQELRALISRNASAMVARRSCITRCDHGSANAATLTATIPPITGGEVSDYKGYDLVMDAEAPDPKVLIADKGYDADRIREHTEANGGVAVIPMRRGRKVQTPIDDHIYALRNRIERCFNKLKNARRLATRYDKTAASYLGFIHIVSMRLWTKHFVNTA
jgi:transposase